MIKKQISEFLSRDKKLFIMSSFLPLLSSQNSLSPSLFRFLSYSQNFILSLDFTWFQLGETKRERERDNERKKEKSRVEKGIGLSRVRNQLDYVRLVNWTQFQLWTQFKLWTQFQLWIHFQFEKKTNPSFSSLEFRSLGQTLFPSICP